MAATLLIVALLFVHPPDSTFRVEVSSIGEGCYVHTSQKVLDGQIVPSNGLVVESKNGVVIVDTPWDTVQTLQLLDWVSGTLGKKVLFCIITHWHEDRIGGIDALLRRGIRVVSTPLTAALARNNGRSSPDPVLPDDTLITCDGTEYECYYPGKGHTEDNIVVWLPEQRVLFGGCFVKSAAAANLGNIADANLHDWPASVLRVMTKFADRRIVVPGHGSWTEKDALEHTLDLLRSQH